MKTLRKNVDLDIETVAILQIEATIHGFGTLKPFLEKVLNENAKKASRSKPKLYSQIITKRSSDLKENLTNKRKKLRIQKA